VDEAEPEALAPAKLREGWRSGPGRRIHDGGGLDEGGHHDVEGSAARAAAPMWMAAAVGGLCEGMTYNPGKGRETWRETFLRARKFGVGRDGEIQ
jgi:hypothetical protein